MQLNQLFSLGTEHLPFSSANKVRTMNIIGLITTVISGLYTLNYVFVFQHYLVAGLNFLFTLAYAATLVFNAYGANRGSKIWFFSVLMLHLVVCTNLYVTNASGFHLYYYLVPTGAFLLFELKEKKEKISLSLIAVALYFYCENTLNTSPLIDLSAEMNHLIYQSVMLVNMLEVILVLIIFVNEIEANETQLRRQATTDSLTGIANRHSFFAEGNTLLSRATVENRPLTVLIFDLDYFKRINDLYGHAAGDLCLTEVASVINRHRRPQDFFARIGGEEFALIMPETTAPEALNLAEAMRISIEQHPIPIIGKHDFNCTASFGIASKMTNSDSLKELLVHADKALYLAKELGRNRVQSYQKSA
ncbi:GGDEF domain-containing protein [Thalassotalea euphylliae]|uniref:GGDEF domain-containing protein n=1 Tax=Thalassotalea euphylliae TaxID=1655234 RepID=UPI00363039C2